MSNEAVIVAACRTAVGKFGGTLAERRRRIWVRLLSKMRC